jgi:hypothetical protein
MNAPALIPTFIPDGFVYVIRDDESGLAKIGYSKDPSDRLRKLQTGSPVRLWLVCVMPGDLATEAALHGVFKERRVHGEWFNDSDGTISDLIRDIGRQEFDRLANLLRADAQACLEHANALEAEGQMAGAA